jgi:hypothetical protein
MILLNFSHPLTPDHMAQVEALAGRPVERVIHAPAQFDHARPFDEQVAALVERVGLTPQEWQTAPILINPPSFNLIAAMLLAHLHGRMGYFPPVVRLRPVEGAVPPRYEIAEIINLQAVRDAARKIR